MPTEQFSFEPPHPIRSELIPNRPEFRERSKQFFEAYECSRRFFHLHNLADLAQHLPDWKDILLTPEQTDGISIAQETGMKTFDQPFNQIFFFPEPQHLYNKTAEIINYCAERRSGTNYHEPWIEGNEQGRILSHITRCRDNNPRGHVSYILLFSDQKIPLSTRDKSPKEILGLFNNLNQDHLPEGISFSGLTLPEYLVIQRLMYERLGDHRFDTDTNNPYLESTSQMTYLVDTIDSFDPLQKGHGVHKTLTACWNPQKEQIRVSEVQFHNHSRRIGTRPVIVVPITSTTFH